MTLGAQCAPVGRHCPVAVARPRARKWQQMLEAGKVANRVALAKQLGITPGAVTRILKLLEVMPDIQRFLESLDSKEATRHFTIKKIGNLVGLPPSEQLIEFGKMRTAFTPRISAYVRSS